MVVISENYGAAAVPRGFIVVKFGGSSLADGEKISNAVRAVVKELQKGIRAVIVVSAMGKTTDLLFETIKTATNCDKMEWSTDFDDVLAMGERTSARIFSAALKASGVRCRYFDPADPDWPIITNDMPMNADPILDVCEERVCKYILPLLEEGTVVVVPGFVGKTLDGRITTMGRGGSDITALVLARALRVKQVILVTDVDGIMTADPKLIKSSRKIPEIDVNSLIGLASCSQKFLQRKALKYKEDWIDVKVINCKHCDLNAEGTIIKGSLKKDIVDISFPENIASITIVGKALSQSHEFLSQMIQKMKNAKVSFLGISANYDSLILYVPERVLGKILKPLHSIVCDYPEAIAIAVRKNLVLLEIKTAGLEETPGVIGGLAKALGEKGINIYGLFTVASSIHVFVDMEHVEEALTVVRESLVGNFEAFRNQIYGGEIKRTAERGGECGKYSAKMVKQ